VSITHLADLQREVQTCQARGEFDEEFAKTYIPTFKFSPPNELKNAKSIVVVAMPCPPTKAIFNWNGKKQAFILPPTYTAYDEMLLQIERFVSEAVSAIGCSIATPRIPMKLLAVRSGLAKYGRKNITYVEGMGSFLRLTAVYTDMPAEDDCWQSAEALPRCEGCMLCQNACQTSAISTDRFLLHAEWCLTYHNEKPADVPFPAWIKREWHNCLIGCIRCQAACPENKTFLGKVGETAQFTQQETELLLKATSSAALSEETVAKMKLLSLLDYYQELPRNLSVLLT
jgi:epoxyqueuosine reductase